MVVSLKCVREAFRSNRKTARRGLAVGLALIGSLAFTSYAHASDCSTFTHDFTINISAGFFSGTVNPQRTGNFLAGDVLTFSGTADADVTLQNFRGFQRAGSFGAFVQMFSFPNGGTSTFTVPANGFRTFSLLAQGQNNTLLGTRSFTLSIRCTPAATTPTSTATTTSTSTPTQSQTDTPAPTSGSTPTSTTEEA